MGNVVIDNPIINGPYAEPTRLFRFSDDGITDEILAGRRRSEYFIPIPQPKKRSAQLQLPDEWTRDRLRENDLVNQIRARLAVWRMAGRPGTTHVTRALLAHWTDTGRERPLFFCQIEALEAVVYLTECAQKQNDAWIATRVREANEEANPGLFRLAMKMATGTGKTVVMAMLIAWHTINKVTDPRDRRFSDAFLVVAPGITIRDRLRVLLPSDPTNYYRELDLVPVDLQGDLARAQIVITNFHSFMLRETREGKSASKTTKQVLAGGSGAPSPFQETPDQMVRRVCRDLGGKRNLVILNDEAHHCYRRKTEPEVDEQLTGPDRLEAQTREDEARIWISGVEAVRRKVGVRAIYDLSATPFFLSGSGYREGTLFPLGDQRLLAD